MSDIELFADRGALEGDLGLRRALGEYDRLDVIAVAAEIAVVVHLDALRAALDRAGFLGRFVIYDPSAANAVHYDALVRGTFGQDPEVKRAQAGRLLALAEQVKGGSGGGRLEVKVIRGRPLLYNLWLASDGSGCAGVGHLSVNVYDTERGGPALRTGVAGSPLMVAIQAEFEHVWGRVAEGVE